jgi:hypothetical protein
VAAPRDAHRVLDAVRLGWCLAEVHGRNRPVGRQPTTSSSSRGNGSALPLRPERTEAEARAQAEQLLTALSAALEVDATPTPAGEGQPTTYAEQLATLTAARLAAAGGAIAPDRRVGFDDLTDLLRRWDAHIQDTLNARSDMAACGYLLGRGLAECYWAHDWDAVPAASGGIDVAGADWGFLLGPARRGELSRLAGRLGGYLNGLTPTVVAGTLEVWGCVAADKGWRSQPDAPDQLYEQSRRWYELVVLGQDPSTLVQPYALLRSWRSARHMLRSLWPQLVLAAAGVILIGAALWRAGSGVGSGGGTVLGGLGALGVTAATLTTVLKSTSQALLRRLRQDVYSDLVALAVTVVPTYPSGRRAGGLQRASAGPIVRRAVQSRQLTVATAAPDQPAVATG